MTATITGLPGLCDGSREVWRGRGGDWGWFYLQFCVLFWVEDVLVWVWSIIGIEIWEYQISHIINKRQC